MPGSRVGPYRVIDVGGGEVPFYILPFDADGLGTAPATTAHLMQALERGDHSHVVLFSHGWNNDWTGARTLYDRFVDGYRRLLDDAGARPAGWRPLLIGMFWPSIALVASWEDRPRFAGLTPVDGEGVDDEDLVLAVGAQLAPDARGRFYELARRDSLDDRSARELATLLGPLYAGADEIDDEPADVEALLGAWRELAGAGSRPEPLDDDAFDAPENAGGGGPPGDDVRVAGIRDWLDPRNIVRGLTVWQMKDRAGRVGAAGVARLLRGVLGATDAPVVLLGHSYGCKVMLSALCAAPLPRKVRGALLLQPALSYLAFAAALPRGGRPGGYRDALQRSELPLMVTYSKHDAALRRAFHLAVRRTSDYGEITIAAPDTTRPPSRFAAMGGYGPGGLADGEDRRVEMGGPGTDYDLGGVRVLALDGQTHISGHSDIVQDASFWALHRLLTAKEGPS